MAAQTKKPENKHLHTDQRGIASFMLTIVLMLVITLIVLGFSQIARRNQREALDDQLSTQAFYAAETGVNLVQHLLQSGPPSDKTDCITVAAPAQYVNAQLNLPTASNSCLLVTNAPGSLVYDDIGTNNTVVPIKAQDSLANGGSGVGSGTLTLTWKTKDTSPGDVSNCSTYNAPDKFTSDLGGSNCPYGVLRFDLVDVTAAGALTASNLENQTMTVFAPPTHNAQAIYKKEPGNPAGTPGNVQCTDTSCTLSVSGVNFDHNYYMRLTSTYKDVSMSSIAGHLNSGADVKFLDAQILVDSTGKAQDVLRRIQVRLNEVSTQVPAYAIESSGSVCKQYTTTGAGSFSSANADCPIN